MFSHAEEAVIKILGRRKMTIREIAETFYKGRSAMIPMDPQNYIGNVLRRISKKCSHNKLSWNIVGERSGGGRTVWRKPLKSKRA